MTSSLVLRRGHLLVRDPCLAPRMRSVCLRKLEAALLLLLGQSWPADLGPRLKAGVVKDFEMVDLGILVSASSCRREAPRFPCASSILALRLRVLRWSARSRFVAEVTACLTRDSPFSGKRCATAEKARNLLWRPAGMRTKHPSTSAELSGGEVHGKMAAKRSEWRLEPAVWRSPRGTIWLYQAETSLLMIP